MILVAPKCDGASGSEGLLAPFESSAPALLKAYSGNTRELRSPFDEVRLCAYAPAAKLARYLDFTADHELYSRRPHHPGNNSKLLNGSRGRIKSTDPERSRRPNTDRTKVPS